MHPVGQNIKYCCFELFIQTNQFAASHIFYANTVILLKAKRLWRCHNRILTETYFIYV